MEKETNKPELLFISPVIPAKTGTGLSMRAFSSMQMLAKHFNISLLVVLLYPDKNQLKSSAVLDLCSRFEIVIATSCSDNLFTLKKKIASHFPALCHYMFRSPLEWLPRNSKIVQSAGKMFSNSSFDVIHIFRFYMYPIAQEYMDQNKDTKVHVDIDDIESIARSRIADLYKQNEQFLSHRISSEASFYEKKEIQLLHTFDQVIVCSSQDADMVQEKFKLCSIKAVPTRVQSPLLCSCPENETSMNSIISFLFVGTFNYYPNCDAILYFCTQIIPLIREKTSKPFKVKVIGVGIDKTLQKKLSYFDEIQLLGYVDNLTPYYSISDIVIAPIRAGGGTRVKIIEALAHKKPVISTHIGAEGLLLHDNDEIILSDEPGDFAEKCVRLMNDKIFRNKIAESGYKAFIKNYRLDSCSGDNP